MLSNDMANAALNRVQVVPISSRFGHLYPAEACVTVGKQQRKAMADQIATVSEQRLRRCMGRLAQEDVAAVARAVRVQLDP